MKHEPEPAPGAKATSTSVAVMVSRMKRLSRRHRTVHLRTLIGQLPLGSIRRAQLVALLLDEIASLGDDQVAPTAGQRQPSGGIRFFQFRKGAIRYAAGKTQKTV
jgi:hypothetical protein